MKRSRRIKIVVGTRGSELALRQTGLVVDRLRARWAGLNFEITVIKTRGDDAKTAIRDVRAGRKGLFTGAIERALLSKKIDLAMRRSILKAANFSLVFFRVRFFCPLADRALSPCKYVWATNRSGNLSMGSLILTPGLRCARSANFCGYWMQIATNPSECWQSLMGQR